MHQHRRLAFGLEASEHALNTLKLTREHGERELEHIEPCHIEYGRTHLFKAQLTGRVEECQLLYFLVCRQGIALNPVRKELQSLRALCTGLDLVTLQGQALSDPPRQGTGLDFLHLTHHAHPFKGLEPGALALGFI